MLAYGTVYAFMVGQLWFDSATAGPEPGRSQIRMAADQMALDSDDLFEFGLEVVISGLRERIAP
jgi:hypothetical protein